MHLFNKRKSHGTDFKARLEHKLYLARENPELDFDISECDLKNVPQGIFSLCKVFRKDSLFLQNNHLSSLNSGGNIKDLCLLEVLDLSFNFFTRLTDEIKFLTNLRVFNLKNNQLKHLPNTISYLARLQSLDVSNNCLENVPSTLGNLKQLQLLDLRGNVKLKTLPVTLCQAVSLGEILVDSTTLVYPPPVVVSQGAESVKQFLAEESGLNYEQLKEKSDVDTFHVESPKKFTDSTDFHAKIMQLEKLKNSEVAVRYIMNIHHPLTSRTEDGLTTLNHTMEIKHQGLLALEQDLEEQQRREFELQYTMKQSRERLLDNLMEHQSKLESEIRRVHQNHEVERELLIQKLLEEEHSSDVIISQLLALRGGTSQDPATLQRVLQLELQEEEELLNIRQRDYEALRRKDVLAAMEAMLEEEYQREEKLREYEEGRALSTKTLLSQEVDNDNQLALLLKQQGQTQTELVGRIQQDEELQRAAVGALLERGDARSWGLVQQVNMVEQQLAALTSAEMQRKKLELLEQVSDLCEKRVALSALLVDLLAQQEERRLQLLRTMEEMDRRRWIHGAEEMDSTDFWLHEYQRLLDSRPGALVEIERSIDPLLAQHLILGGVLHCIPLLSQSLLSVDALTSLTDDGLQDMGINVDWDRKNILEAVRHYLEERSHSEIKMKQIELTAPANEEKEEKGATSIVIYNSDAKTTAECVVCMELQCEVIFVPCGHLCCCIKCAEALATCPMCRAEVQQKIRAILP